MVDRATVEAFLTERQRGWLTRDPEVLGRSHAEDGVVRSPIFANLQGRKAITDAYQSLFRSFTDWQLSTRPALIDGLRVAQPFDVVATHTGTLLGFEPTGRRFEIHGVLLFTLTPDCLIADEQRIYDFTGLLIQVGVLRGKPAF
ncbi:MAG TPA: ester cyclase [Vicinamibacterales bacterium]|jgi:SnoaL-like polyketide cyclase|nr:ester cyclase [Vicinamibacterales bacterium]